MSARKSIFPASNLFLEISIIETPVSFSLLSIACWIGHAPLYFGSSEGCITYIPSGNLSIKSLGTMWPKLATKLILKSSLSTVLHSPLKAILFIFYSAIYRWNKDSGVLGLEVGGGHNTEILPYIYFDCIMVRRVIWLTASEPSIKILDINNWKYFLRFKQFGKKLVSCWCCQTSEWSWIY